MRRHERLRRRSDIMGIAVKICGLSTPETVDAAIKYGASHIGFMFFPASPRHVTLDQAEALAARIPDHIGKVGVFVDPDDQGIEEAISRRFLSALQLNATTPARLLAIKDRAKIETWGVAAIKRASDMRGASDLASIADRLLYDAKTPDNGSLPGGMGLRFDWSLLKGAQHPKLWALAGGLEPANVLDAIKATGAPMVDVSSGVETAPGIKDVDKIAAFLKATRAL